MYSWFVVFCSFLSSITLIGQPAEAFLFGSQLWYFGISSFLVIPIVGYVFAPFFQTKKYISAYEVGRGNHVVIV